TIPETSSLSLHDALPILLSGCHLNDRIHDKGHQMLIGYARVSKADGSQTTDLQRDALLAAGVTPEQIYEDQASGKQDDRPQLARSEEHTSELQSRFDLVC